MIQCTLNTALVRLCVWKRGVGVGSLRSHAPSYLTRSAAPSPLLRTDRKLLFLSSLQLPAHPDPDLAPRSRSRSEARGRRDRRNRIGKDFWRYASLRLWSRILSLSRQFHVASSQPSPVFALRKSSLCCDRALKSKPLSLLHWFRFVFCVLFKARGQL